MTCVKKKKHKKVRSFDNNTERFQICAMKTTITNINNDTFSIYTV